MKLVRLYRVSCSVEFICFSNDVSHHYFLCRQIHGHSLLSHIKNSWHTSELLLQSSQLGYKRTLFVREAVDPKEYMFVVCGITGLACIIAATFFSIKIHLSVRLHVNEIQVLKLQHVPQNAQMVNVWRMGKFSMLSVYVCFVLMVCYVLEICKFFPVAFTSSPSTIIKHLQVYTGTLAFLNSSPNPLIYYCWKMKHTRHTIIALIRNAFTKQN